jgi:hypothetical protein
MLSLRQSQRRMRVSILYPSGIPRAGRESGRGGALRVALAAVSSQIQRLFPILFSSL